MPALLRQPKYLILLLMLCLSASVLLFPIADLTTAQNHTLALVLLVVPLWSTGVIPEFLTALVFFLLAILAGLAPPSLVFSGFSSTALWLIFAGGVMGMGIQTTGLGDRLATFLQQVLAGSYRRMIFGLVLISLMLGFLMPSSMGRLIMMLPIVMALATRLGFEPGSNGRTGIILAVAIGAHIPTVSILPSNIPNMVLSGAAESLYGIQLGFTEYLILHFPILGLMKSLVLAMLILKVYPVASTDPAALKLAQREEGPLFPHLNGLQKRMMTIMLAALALWLTDDIHGISPAWVGLAAAVLLLLPKVGLVDAQKFNMNVTMLLLIAGVLGLGALINSSGVGQWLAQQLEIALPMEKGNNLHNFLSLAAIAFLSTLPTTQAGSPAMLTPMAQHFADSSGLSVYTVLMTQVMGYANIMFPYQSGPLMMAIALTGEASVRVLKVMMPLALIGLLVLVPLDYLWWEALGMFQHP
ncbi:SLC13 family permease [Parathalassolituus penaei]|uniref:SLC13 family permease n=1 Tax=Parathalassolituus penaei TaxID=2997323 RepID=A0A9X3IQG7_9GAMM|nr:SLC13 family permease [Parathalassolituus penaei]MCY0964147.1 SLC13 family permease [Parathalassolituus penaei]